MKYTKRGISLLVLLITIIVMIIIATAVIMTSLQNNQVQKANEAVLKTDMQTMLDNFENVYQDRLYDYGGDITQMKDEDFKNVIPEKYRDEFKATKDGVIYFGTDETIITYATSMGLIITGVTHDIEIRNLYVTSTNSTIQVQVNLEVPLEQVTYQYFYRKQGSANWESFASGSNDSAVKTRLESNNTYEIKVIATDGKTGKTSEPKETRIMTNDIVLGNLILRQTNQNGEIYREGTWTNKSVYMSVNEGSSQGVSTYTVSGSNSVAGTSSPSTISNEGVSTAQITTSNGISSSKSKTYTIKIDKTPPTGSLGTVSITNNSATVRVTNASDPAGSSSDVSGLNTFSFYLDGTLIVIQQSSQPEFTFTKLASGSTHTAKVVIRDKANNEKVSQINFTVK